MEGFKLDLLFLTNSLLEYLRLKSPIPLEQSISIALQIVIGMNYLSSCGICHRFEMVDLFANNVKGLSM